MTTELLIPGNIPTMNTRIHWREKGRLRDQYQLLFRSQTTNRHAGRVRVELFRNSCAVKIDFDNLVSSGKTPIDSIVRAGIISDDNPEVIVERHYEHVRISRKIPPFTTIRITDIN